MKTTTSTTAVVLDENTVLMPPGDYWLGDPCYFVPNDDWMTWLHAADYENQNNLFAYLHAYPVLGFHTKYGDGEYRGTDGFRYGVDAGLIGLTPVALNDDPYKSYGPDAKLGTKVHFDKPTLCENEDGLMTFGDLVIDTGDWELDDAYDDDDEELGYDLDDDEEED